ncbi:hypothetical protein [Streptomyces sp. NPDC056361]|uniref:hypothetical protein n=1 Tax=Streptomyces sp. NPDC056361 TaxID=3345795 RepID=UPI0035DC3369
MFPGTSVPDPDPRRKPSILAEQLLGDTDQMMALTAMITFTALGGGDLREPRVENAALAALTTAGQVVEGLHAAGVLDRDGATQLKRPAAAAREGFQQAIAQPGLLPPTPPGPASDAEAGGGNLRDIAVWSAGLAPDHAAAFVDAVLASNDATIDTVLRNVAEMLDNSADSGNPWTSGSVMAALAGDADRDPIVETIDTLVSAARIIAPDTKRTTADAALAKLRHPDADRFRHRRRVVLQQLLLGLGGFIYGRAREAATSFRQLGGGDLRDPMVLKAAQTAFDTYTALAGQTGNGVSPGQYELAEPHLTVARNSFKLAYEYTVKRSGSGAG